MRVLGFMTGTSLDAVDMAVLETDGRAVEAFGPADERKLSAKMRDLALETTAVARAWKRGTAAPGIFDAFARVVAEEHLGAAEAFLAGHGLTWRDLDLVGMHGQTVLHERPMPGIPGRTVQLGDAEWLARRTGVPVAFDFRAADVAAGGQGAPLAPVYHRARARVSDLERPLAVLNIGGVANVTHIAANGLLTAFDTGPGNGMIDLLLQARGAGRYDEGGRLAAAGRVDEAVLARLLADPYFAEAPPKSLDRHHFPPDVLADLSLEDAAATLVAFTAEAVALGLKACEGARSVVVCGGGRHNPQIMAALKARAHLPVLAAEEVGWRGDSVEAEAFAYLAARCWNGFPISFPGTTGVPHPMTGGRIARP